MASKFNYISKVELVSLEIYNMLNIFIELEAQVLFGKCTVALGFKVLGDPVLRQIRRMQLFYIVQP